MTADHPTPFKPKPYFALERIEVPNDTFGQDHWLFAVPWTLRALLAPKSRGPMPAVPDAGSEFNAVLGYWSALLHLLVFGFGWNRPDRGLRWWYEHGFPTDDRKFALVDEVWRADGQLDWFAAWLWTTGANNYLRSDYPDAVEPDQPINRDWIDAVARQVDASETFAPFSDTDGTDPLHLAPHTFDGYRSPANTRIDDNARKATIVLDALPGWYHTMNDLIPRGWNVDVVVIPHGLLGTFKRSPKTGLWYMGSHRYHLVGN